MLVVSLGYFNAKPVVLNPGFHQIKQDLKYVYPTVLPGPGCRPFNLTPKENERIYQRIFQFCNYRRWNAKDHGAALSTLQKIISKVVGDEQGHMADSLEPAFTVAEKSARRPNFRAELANSLLTFVNYVEGQ